MHSYILNTNDAAWKIAFEPDEVEEIMEASSENGFNNPLPNEMLDTLSKLNKKVSKHNITTSCYVFIFLII